MKTILLLIIISIFAHQSIYGQCNNVQIGKMIKWGLSEDEINEVCEEEIQKKKGNENKIEKNDNKKESIYEKKVVESKEYENKTIKEYPNIFGTKTPQGNLRSLIINPPKLGDIKVYFDYEYTFYSILYSKYAKSEKENFFKDQDLSIGFDYRYDQSKLDFISISLYESNYTFDTLSRFDGSGDSQGFHRHNENLSDYTFKSNSIEYIYPINNSILLGLRYAIVEFKKNIKYNYQWYNTDNNSTVGLNNGTIKYSSNHDYNYFRLRSSIGLKETKIDLFYYPEVTSKSNFSGDYTGESTTGFGQIIGLDYTIKNKDIEFLYGITNYNENEETYDPNGQQLRVGCFFNLDFYKILVFSGLSYSKFESIEDVVEPRTSLNFNLTTYFTLDELNLKIGYNYSNHKYGDLNSSSDKYRNVERHINDLSIGAIIYL